MVTAVFRRLSYALRRGDTSKPQTTNVRNNLEKKSERNAHKLTFNLATFCCSVYLMLCLTFYRTYILPIFGLSIRHFIWHLLFDNVSQIYDHVFGILSGIHFDILSGRYFDKLSGSLVDIYTHRQTHLYTHICWNLFLIRIEIYE